jgi:hypothetical protein
VELAAQKRRLDEFPSARPGDPVPATIAGATALMDSALRRLQLTVALHEYPEKKVVMYLIHLDLARGAFVPSGLGGPIASRQARHGVVDTEPSAKAADEIREAVIDLVQEAAEKWTRANPSKSATPSSGK